MTIYTAVADANGDFNVAFSLPYSGGEKITVRAEKDSAEKTIELYAPSAVQQMNGISFSGSLNAFPENIGIITLSGITGAIASYAFDATTTTNKPFFSKATGLIIGDGVVSLGLYSFRNWVAATSLTLPNSLNIVGSYAFSGWVAATSVNFGAGVTTINTFAFEKWSSVLSLTIPDTVTSIGNYAFSQWTSATSLNFGTGLTTIPQYAFYQWSSMQSLVIPSHITSVANNAFMNWSACKIVTLGTGLTNIGSLAFESLTSCDEIICLKSTPPTLSNNSFQGLKVGCVFKVPAASLGAYQSAANWSSFASQMIGV